MPRRDFRHLWVAAAGGNLGDGLVVAVFPLLAVQLTDDPRLVAGATLARTLPYTVVPLLAGVLVDRLNRRRLIILANLTRAAAALALAATFLARADPLAILYVVAFLITAGETFADLGTAALLPSVVGRRSLDRANSRLQGTESTFNEFLGPALGGLLVLGGGGLAVGGIAGAYLVAAAGALFLHDHGRPARTAPTTVRKDVTDGLRFLWRHTVLRTITLMVTVMAAAWSAWAAVLVLHVVEPGPVGLNSSGYGVLLSALAAGGVAGSFVAAALRRRFGTRSVLTADVVATATMIGTPALTANIWLIGLATFAGGFGSGMWNVVVRTMRQLVTPDELLGRVTGASRLMGWGATPVGAGLAGLVAHGAGARLVFGLGAAASVLMIAPIIRGRIG